MLDRSHERLDIEQPYELRPAPVDAVDDRQ
jgi:hypothetical protein